MLSSRPGWRLSFQAKVLVPVVSIMVVLVAATILVVNRRITAAFQAEAAQKVATAAAVFKNSQKIRTRNLLLRYRNIPNEPRVQAAAQTGDPRTVQKFVADLIEQYGGEIVFFTDAKGHALARVIGDAQLNSAPFEAGAIGSVGRALEGLANVDTILVGDRLFDVVSVPVKVEGYVVGVLTFGAEISQSVAEEFKQLTHTEVVFRTKERVVVSTVAKANLHDQLLSEFSRTGGRLSSNVGAGQGSVREIILDSEHFLGLSGQFASLNDEQKLDYVLLSSYEQPLLVLHATQHMLGLFSLLGIIVSTAFVWAVIRKITQPLRELRDSAEAVGRGDFSQRVAVTSDDECAELALVFNQMTGNLKTSREELEKTVETLKTTQAQLIQSEKLSAVGEFVAGVAHELNNPLTSVVGFAELMQQSDVSERHRRFLDLIVNSAQRCHKIVQGLLSFARQHKPERKAVKLQGLIESTIGIVQYQLRTNNIEVVTQLDPGLPRVIGDSHQLQQVFLNIINNARQAIEAHRPKGTIRISAETTDRTVRLLFQDDGPGISAENLSRIFNPFFTTKEVGKGTGLGLSLSYGIIKEHGGSLNVESQLGAGATFIVELPISEEGAETGTSFFKRPASAAFDGSGKKVLVVDDEELILSFIREALSANGCQLDVARDGETALARLREQHYDVTVCDWRMPGLTGQQLYEQVRAEDASAATRFIFMTGDVMNEKTQTFLKETGNICLAKPFSVDEFRSVIGQFLKAA